MTDDLYNAEIIISVQLEGDDIEEQLEVLAVRIADIAELAKANITCMNMGWAEA